MALDTAVLRSRRALLVGTAGGLAALAAQALGRPAPMRAAPADVQLGAANSTTDATSITNTTAGGVAFGGYASGNGIGVYGDAPGGTAVSGYSGSGTGVRGYSGSGTGVRGEAGAGQTSIYGYKSGAGTAVWGDIDDTTSNWGAVFGRTNGTGPGVIGENNATGDGIYGESTLGRGGRFKGKMAQIRLVPSTATSHPSSGAAGDIFLDKSKRLWLCKGGTTWVRIV